VFVHVLAVLQVGMFPDVCEALSLGHLSRGDATSAMVASEWYMRNQHFPGWGRPYEFASELFHKVRCADCISVAQLTVASQAGMQQTRLVGPDPCVCMVCAHADWQARGGGAGHGALCLAQPLVDPFKL
jgi:hypothetical protein